MRSDGPTLRFRFFLCGAVLSTAVAGCESFSSMSGSLFSTGAGNLEEVEADKRERFRTSGDPEAIRWLLGRRLYTGMPLAEVSRVLGDDGEREYEDDWLKSGGGHYRADDEVYKWGPDAKGTMHYLVFRNGVLTNFDPEQYR